jgi:hypothetical protein
VFDIISTPRFVCNLPPGCQVKNISGREANDKQFAVTDIKTSAVSTGKFRSSVDNKEYTTSIAPFADALFTRMLPEGKNRLSFTIECADGSKKAIVSEIHVKHSPEQSSTDPHSHHSHTAPLEPPQVPQQMLGGNGAEGGALCAINASWVIPKLPGQDPNTPPPDGVTHPIATLWDKKQFVESKKTNKALWDAIHSPLGMTGGEISFNPGTVHFPEQQLKDPDAKALPAVSEYGMYKVYYLDSKGTQQSAIAFMLSPTYLSKLAELAKSYEGVPIFLFDFFVAGDEGVEHEFDSLSTLGRYVDIVPSKKFIIMGLNKPRGGGALLPRTLLNPGWTIASNLGVAHKTAAHELGHALGLGHDQQTGTLMYPSLDLGGPLMEKYQACRVRALCYNSIPPSSFQSTFNCGDGWLHQGGDSGSTFEQCESNLYPYTTVDAPFAANCDEVNPTPNGKPFPFGNNKGTTRVWGSQDTPFYCYRDVPKGSSYYELDPKKQKCRVVKFCGDGFIDTYLGEGCDPQSRVENQGCAADKKCGGVVTQSDGSRVEKNCLCVPKCDAGKTWCDAAQTCCNSDQSCTQNGCENDDDDPSLHTNGGKKKRAA